jgi:hypothetical protein
LRFSALIVKRQDAPNWWAQPPPLFLSPDEPGSAESLLIHEMAVASFLSSHSLSFPFEEMLLISSRTMAHIKAIMLTSIISICFVGIFNRVLLKVVFSFIEKP